MESRGPITTMPHLEPDRFRLLDEGEAVEFAWAGRKKFLKKLAGMRSSSKPKHHGPAGNSSPHGWGSPPSTMLLWRARSPQCRALGVAPNCTAMSSLVWRSGHQVCPRIVITSATLHRRGSARLEP